MPIYNYTVPGGGEAKVDTDSEMYLAKVNWLETNSPATHWVAEEIIGVGVGGHVAMPQGMVIFYKGELSVMLSSYLLHISPNVALPEIYSNLAPGEPLPSPFPRWDDGTPAPDIDPVGPKWPVKGSGIWHVSSQFVEADWPMGSPPFTKKDETGLDRAFYRTKVRGTSAPSGTVGGGATYVPAWTDRKPA